MSDEGTGPPPSATPRAQPFHCPYCGEEDLRPDAGHDAWACQSCTRVFTLRFVGLRRS